MGFFKHFHKGSHCYLTSFGEVFGIFAFIGSLYIMFFQNMEFGKNLVVLIGLALSGGAVGLVWYYFANGRKSR